MNVKEKIIQTLFDIQPKIGDIKSDWYIIGSSAMILTGIEIEDTLDIDILTTHLGSDEFQSLFLECKDINTQTKEDDLFRSNFARFSLPLMDVEVMGDLQVKKGDLWQDVSIKYFDEISVGNIKIQIPTQDELKRLLLLFGREKDLKRINLFR